MSTPWLRRIAIAVAALLLLLVVAAAVLLATFDANRTKGLAIDWMRAHHQRKLAIDGPIELSLLPRLAVKLSRLRLSERGRDDEFAAIDEAALSVRTLPLLRGQVVVDRILARGVRAAYLRDSQGASNVDDLVGGATPATKKQTDTTPAAATPLRWDISAIELEDVRLKVQDRKAGLAGEFAVHSFTTGRLANRQESPVALRASVQLSQPQSAQVTVEAGLNLKIDFDQGSFEIGALKIRLAGQQAQDPFELSLDWPALKFNQQQFTGSTVTGRLKLGGPTALTADITSAAPSGNFDTLRLPGLKLALEAQSGPHQIKGTAAADLLVHPDRGAAAIDHLQVQTSVIEPGLPPVQLQATGSAGIDAKTALWQLSGALNTNRFDIKGQASFAGKTPSIRAAAHFDSLDVNKLLAPGKPAPTKTTATAPSDTPVPLEALRVVDGEFTFDAAALAFRQYRITDARFVASLSQGRLQISRLAGRAWGGSFAASGLADADSSRVAIKLDADGVDVNQLLKEVADKDLIAGNGHVAADLQSSGKSVGALRSNLAGTVALRLRDGSIKGINLARVLRQAQAALSLKKDAIAQANNAEKTDFSEMSASARVSQGVATSDDLDVKSPFLRIGGAGTFDIGRGRVDYTARATVIASAAGQGGTGLEALRGLAVPVVLSGPFSAIDWKIQWSAIASSVIKGKVQDAVKGAVKDRLKGLFK